MDDLELQDEPLQIRIMDYDTYSANDAIGKVYIDLNPLLLSQPVQRPPNTTSTDSAGVAGCVMSGWLPVFDTMHGIRGEVNLIVKVELFSDLNKFRQSSCGVQFFCCPEIPEGYKAQFIPGFVEELVVNDDPEYKWIDKIRTPRASNEARQLLFSKVRVEFPQSVRVSRISFLPAVRGAQEEDRPEGPGAGRERCGGLQTELRPGGRERDRGAGYRHCRHSLPSAARGPQPHPRHPLARPGQLGGACGAVSQHRVSPVSSCYFYSSVGREGLTTLPPVMSPSLPALGPLSG